MPDSQEAIYNRLDRMEAKLEKLVDAVTELVRVEATLQNIDGRLNNHSLLIDKNDKRLDVVEQRIPIYNLAIRIGAIIGSVFIVGIATAIYQLVIAV